MSWEAANMSPGWCGSGLVPVFSPAEAGGKFWPLGGPTRELARKTWGFPGPPTILSEDSTSWTIGADPVPGLPGHA